MEFLREFAIELLVAFALLLLGGFVTALVFVLFPFSRLSRLFRFLGITRKKPSMVVYLSTLLIRPGGAIDADGIPRSYSGPAAAEYEIRLIATLSPLLSWRQSVPTLAKYLLSRHWTYRDIHIRVELSPLRQRDIQFGSNFLLVGSPAYNEATKYYLENRDCFLKFEEDSASIMIAKGDRQGQRIRPRGDLAMLQKVIDQEHKTVVMIAAGLGVNGTRGAVQYLMNNWQELQREYEDGEFGLCIDYPTVVDDPEGYLKPTVVKRLAEKKAQSLVRGGTN